MAYVKMKFFLEFYFIYFSLLLFLKYLFIWLCRVLVAAGGLLSCGMHVGSSSRARDRTQAPCIGSAES